MAPRPRRTEDDRWRDEAHDALRKLSRAMDFFLQVASLLVGLTEEHKPNDFSHCAVCGQPWPCRTMQVVEEIGTRFRNLQENNSDS
jgi:hypothetical protein